MTILVTGGAGYIGSHTAKSLAKAGHTPVTFDNLSRGHAHAVRWGPLVAGDLADRNLLLRTLKTYKVDAILHFAAYAYVADSMLNPGSYFQNNVVNSLHLLDAAVEVGIRHFVLSSTCATYGKPDYLPIDESHPQHPVNPYGESKLIVEQLLKWYGKIHNLNWTILRYFNAAGCDPEGELGEEHRPETHIIPLLLESVCDPRQTVSIYGNDYRTPDGTAIRDYIHVSDLAAAHILALRYLKEGGQSCALNLGTGRGHSIKDLIETVALITGSYPSVKTCCRRAGDPAELVADPRLSSQLLGWSAKHSSIIEIIETAWKYRQKMSGKLKNPAAYLSAQVCR